jgi:hypothetical protein
MKKLVLITTLLTISYSCSWKAPIGNSHNKSRERIQNRENAVRYDFKNLNYSKSLELFSNNEFIFTETLNGSLGNSTVKEYFGDYHQDSTSLQLYPKEIAIKKIPEHAKEHIKSTYFPYEEGSKINTNYLKFAWNHKEYLLSEQFNTQSYIDEKNDFQRFANFVNQGIEPDDSGAYFTRIIQTTSLNSDSLDLKRIPQKWRSYFIKTPIQARVIEHRQHPSENHHLNKKMTCWHVTIDKGTADGVHQGLAFTTQFEEVQIKIDSLDSGTSYGHFKSINTSPTYLEIGTEMRTQW